MEPVISIRELNDNGARYIYDLFDPDAARFLGAFVSEGNMTEQFSVKITCSNLDFIYSAMGSIKRIFGGSGFTDKEPTGEDRYHVKGYHKYFRKLVARWLIESYGIVPGKKILNNEGLPEFIMENRSDARAKRWIVNYLQMRFSGDGHVRNSINLGKNKQIITRRVALSRNMALGLEKYVIDEIRKNYTTKRPIRDYPPLLISRLKEEARKSGNFPRELADIQLLLDRYFGIRSKIYPYGLRCIYFDRKRDMYIASAIYKLVISRKEDIIKFRRDINFADFDAYNRDKLINLVNTYKTVRAPDYSAGTIGC